MKVGIIGDSWVSAQKLDSGIIKYLRDRNIKCEVISFGWPGAKSRQVLKNISECKQIFQCDYCFVICGINDSVAQMGKKYYVQNLKSISKKLIESNVVPIIVSLSAYGVDETISQMHPFKKTRIKIKALLTNGGRVNNIEDYRNFLYDN